MSTLQDLSRKQFYNLYFVLYASARETSLQKPKVHLSTCILQTYDPAAHHPDEEIEEYNDEVKRTSKIVKSDDILIVMGDTNAKVRKGHFEKIQEKKKRTDLSNSS